MCEYCRVENPLPLTNELFGESYVRHFKGIGALLSPHNWFLEVNGGIYTWIKFCPKCGNELL